MSETLDQLYENEQSIKDLNKTIKIMEKDLMEEGETQNQTAICENESLSAAINILTDSTSMKNLFSDHTNSIPSNPQMRDANYHIQIVLNKQIEQCGLLDEQIKEWVEKLAFQCYSFVNQVYDHYLTSEIKFLPCKDLMFVFETIQNFCRVRGWSFIIRFFNNDADMLERVVKVLEQFQNVFKENISSIWPLFFTLFIYTHLLSSVPFNLSTLDSKMKGGGGIIDSLMTIFLEHMKVNNRASKAACIAISKILTREDSIKNGQLEKQLKFVTHELKNLGDTFQRNIYESNIQCSLNQIFKFGYRNELQNQINIVFELYRTYEKQDELSKNTDVRRFRTKLASRLALTYLKPQFKKTTYSVKKNKLFENEQSSSTLKVRTNQEAKESQEVSSAKDVLYSDVFDENLIDQEKLEDFINIVFYSLEDNEIVVRWAAAKGLARITERLTEELSNEILQNLLDIKNQKMSQEFYWHGCLLALGEMIRKGYIAYEFISECLDVAFIGLYFDYKSGLNSVGKIIRDSACQLIWCFSRAYDPDILKQFNEPIAKNLLAVALQDREINCRRAASASFQEHVGRQLNFDHGIEILTEADFFTLGNLNNAYLDVSPFIAQFPTYRRFLIDHLLERKLFHQDDEIRILAAQTLSVLSGYDPEQFIQKSMEVIENVNLKDYAIKHGILMFNSCLLVGLAGKSHIFTDMHFTEQKSKKYKVQSIESLSLICSDYRKEFLQTFPAIQNTSNIHLQYQNEKLQTLLNSIPSMAKENKWFSEKYSEMIKIGYLTQVENLSACDVQFSPEFIKETIQNLHLLALYDFPEIPSMKTKFTTKKQFESLFRVAVSAFISKFQSVDLLEDTKIGIKQTITQVMNNSNNNSITRNFPIILSSFSNKILSIFEDEKELKNNLEIRILDGQINRIVVCLLELQDSKQDAETRCSIVWALRSLILTQQEWWSCEDRYNKVIELILNKAIKDQTIDKRGDIGSWIRINSMNFFSCSYFNFKYYSSLKSLENKITFLNHLNSNLIKIIGNAFAQLAQHQEPIVMEALQLLFSYAQFINEINNTNQVDFEQTKLNNPLNQKIIKYFQVEKDTILWKQPYEVFSRLMNFIDNFDINYEIVKGLVTSMGGLTAIQETNSKKAFLDFMADKSEEDQIKLYLSTTQILMKLIEEKEDRIMLNTLNTLLQTIEISENFNLIQCQIKDDKQQLEFIQEKLKEVYTKSSSVEKSKVVIKIQNIFLTKLQDCKDQISQDILIIEKKILGSLVKSLGSKQALVRSTSAQLMNGYFNLQEVDEMDKFGLNEETQDQLDDLLTTHNWNLNTDTKQNLAKIKELLKVE